jgi:DNA-binding transcriptional MerR regulator
MKTATLTALAAQHHVPYRTLARWIEDGIIEPEHRAGRPGVDIVLSDKNVVELENLIRLRKGGLSLQRARALMEDLAAQGYNPLSQGAFIVVDRKRGRVVRIGVDRRTAREVAGPHKGQYVMIELLSDRA